MSPLALTGRHFNMKPTILLSKPQSLRRSRRGFGLIESTLAMVVFSAAIAGVIKVWIDNAEIQKAQRQADLLQTARIAGQRLVASYRNTLTHAPVANLSTALDGTTLVTPIAPAAGAPAGSNAWAFTRDDLVNLKVLNTNFPTTGTYSSLGNATILVNLSADQTTKKITGTVCYSEPLTKGGVLDTSGLGILMSQMSKGDAVIDGSNSKSNSGVFVASYPGSSTQLRGSNTTITPPNPITGTPAGIICALVGDWGGTENFGRSAYTVVKLGTACSDPNALAWVNPVSSGAQPQHLAWCNNSIWKLPNSGLVGDGCTAGQMAFKDPGSTTDTITPLTCIPNSTSTPVGTLKPSRYVPVKEDITCDSARQGLLGIGATDSKVYFCHNSTWLQEVNGAVDAGYSVVRDVAINTACAQSTTSLGVDSSNKLHFCWGGVWRRYRAQ